MLRGDDIFSVKSSKTVGAMTKVLFYLKLDKQNIRLEKYRIQQKKNPHQPYNGNKTSLETF